MNIQELEKVLKKKVKPHKIFPLDGIMNLPMAIRLKKGIKSKCLFCKEDIKDNTFTAGFKTGHKNMLYHNICYEEQYNIFMLTNT